MKDRAMSAVRRLTTAWTVLAASLVLSLAIGLGSYVAVEGRIESRFNAWVEDASGRLQGRLAAQEALAQGAAALLASSTAPLSPAAFEAYVVQLHLEERYPGLIGLGFAASDSPGPVRLAGEKIQIRFLAPGGAHTGAWLGADLRADPVRRVALERARDLGRPVLSGLVEMIGRDGTPIEGMLLAQPVFPDGVPTTVEERRAALRGYVVGQVDAGRFFAGLAGGAESPIALAVHDGAGGGRRLYRDGGEDAWRSPSLRAERALTASGREWSLVAVGDTDRVALRERLVAPTLTAIGIGLSLLLFGLTRAQARARAQAETTVDAMKRGEEIRAHLLATERSARQEAQRLVVALERSNRELDQFAYVASHDLKSPLRGIANLASWIEEDLADAATPETRRNLDLMRGRVRRLEALIDGILSYSRAGRDEAATEVDVAGLIQEVIGLLAPPPAAVISIGPMPRLVTQRIALEQVLMNLIGNAIKHGGAAPGRDGAVSIEVSARHLDDGGWEFAVSDDGPGIAHEYHERIWQMFQTLRTRDQVEATGIGLAVVKKIVEGRGGAVSLSSTVGRGTRFTVRWPSEEAAEEARPVLATPPPEKPRTAPRAPLARAGSPRLGSRS